MILRADDVLPAEICVLRYALERHAGERPDATYAVFEDGSHWSWVEALHLARVTATGLCDLGVKRGDPVLVMLPNSPDAIRFLLGITYLGAVFVPINTAYRGAILEHVVRDSGAEIAICHSVLLGRLDEVDADRLTTILVTGDEPQEGAPSCRNLLGVSSLRSDPIRLPALDRAIEPFDLMAIIYTSGTTGRSKGVLASYMHAFSSTGPSSWTCLRPDDRQFLHMPIFHIGGTFVAAASLCSGGSIAVVPSFKTDRFWDQVRRMEVTSVFLLGAMATFLLKQPPSAGEREHPLRHVMIVPLGAVGPAFRERFGVDVFTLFNMTEISTPLMSGPNPQKPNVCGRVRDGVDVRLVDANDRPVRVGEPGELVIRTAAPWAMSHGYHGNPQASAVAWRNGWFHTGDVFVQDSDGDFRFVDRLKDAIRRRGENISSVEVEQELLAQATVREAAVVAVPSPDGEDDVLAVLAPQPGASIDPAELFGALRDRLPHFMLPRYIRLLDELPKTPTAKVEKHVLRAEGVTAETWDREVAGIEVRREVLT